MFLGLYILPHNAEQGLVDGRGIKQSSEIVRAILFDCVASYILNYYMGSDQALPEPSVYAPFVMFLLARLVSLIMGP